MNARNKSRVGSRSLRDYKVSVMFEFKLITKCRQFPFPFAESTRLALTHSFARLDSRISMATFAAKASSALPNLDSSAAADWCLSSACSPVIAHPANSIFTRAGRSRRIRYCISRHRVRSHPPRRLARSHPRSPRRPRSAPVKSTSTRQVDPRRVTHTHTRVDAL